MSMSCDMPVIQARTRCLTLAAIPPPCVRAPPHPAPRAPHHQGMAQYPGSRASKAVGSAVPACSYGC